ncbi:MAG TPA: MarR family transcriptional regulator [Polyangiaceae bacterium]|nr:MarR family transcriptional regulator [Polyangiaceae bacterium]
MSHGLRWVPEHYVAYWVNQTSRLLVRAHNLRLRALGLTMAHIPLLSVLATRGPLSQKELTATAGVEQPSMAEMLSRLESEGLLRRKQQKEDKRVRTYELTPEAERRLAKAQAALLIGERESLVGFTEDEKALFRQFLQRMEANLRSPPSTEP